MADSLIQTGERESKLVVDRVDGLAEGIVGLTMRDPDGGQLPEWTPGSHVDLVLREDLIRQYSLCGDPADRDVYRVAVLREPQGRGGSAFVHEEITVGSQTVVRGPRNHFTFRPAPSYLFVAGGIGITPILPMVAAAQASGADWRLVYGGRRADSMAFRAELETYGDRVSLRPQDVAGLLDVPALLGDLAPGTVVYCCGPGTLLTAVEQQCALRPGIALRVERFAAREAGVPARSDTIEVVLRRSGLTLQVPPGRSILEVITAAGIHAAFSCQEGVCGSCETRVLGGDPDHRDSVLDPDERAAGDVMMICVSRSRGPRLELDL